MELTRRAFCLSALAAALPRGAWARVRDGAREMRERFFRGRVRPLDGSAVGKPAKWLG
jgi:hypothetical protein